MSETKVNDGGPAFPRQDVVWNTPEGEQTGTQGHPGMKLRDYFAAKALSGMLGQPANAQNVSAYDNPTAAAQWAYEFADAMLAERDR